MLSPRTTGLITLLVLLSCRIALGTDLSQATLASNPPPSFMTSSPSLAPVPGTVGPSDIGNPSYTPSVMALPVSQTTPIGGGGPLIDASNMHKFYTFSAALRETYDDNVGTSSHAQSSIETGASGSVLVSFPMEDTQFSAGYTIGATYYTQTAGTGNSWQYTNNLGAQLTHTFSERFSLNAADNLSDSPEPNIYSSTGTPYRDGQSISNLFSSGFSAQWTPRIGTQTTYSNTIVRYLDNPSVSTTQDSMQNTASETVSFTVLPTVSASCGGSFDTTTYDNDPRGYSSYTGFVGGSWQPLPNVSTSLRAGGSYTESQQINNSVSGLSPYVDLSGSWQIGRRSSLSGDYAHEITPSDNAGASAQQSDRITANFSYILTSQLSTHLQVSYSSNNTTSSQVYDPTTTSSYKETVYAVEAGASYNFIKYCSFTFDISGSGVSSQLQGDDYNREEVTIGVRGTY